MVNYKSEDTTMLNEFKQTLKENVDNNQVEYGYNFFLKHFFIEDLNKYVRLKTNEVVEVSFGNYNSSIIFVLNSMTQYNYVVFLRNFMKNEKINIDFNEVYFTSYKKTKTDNIALYDEVINLEISCIKPKVIYTIGEYKIKEGNYKVVILDKENMDKMFLLMDKKSLDEIETKELKTRKVNLWTKIMSINNYYNN